MSSRLAMPVTERDHARGPADAPVTLLEYGDFECPHCRAAFFVVEEVLNELGSDVRFVYRHFPLANIHPRAEMAAEAAEAAAAQGQFWDMHRQLFLHQDQLEDDDLLEHAEAIGLDLDRFARELDLGTYEPRMREDFLSGVRSGVNGTPTFYINGVRHDGPPDAASLIRAIEEAGVRA
jgi:formate-nitrite transporter family protein